jgi:hypothetical protein
VLMNRRIKAERDVTMFVPVCSSAAGMHCIISKEGARCKRERVYASFRRPIVTGYTVAQGWPSAQVARWTGYGVGDGFGEAPSVAGEGVRAVVSPVEGGVAGAGNTAPLNIFDLRCFWLCNCSGACCL